MYNLSIDDFLLPPLQFACHKPQQPHLPSSFPSPMLFHNLFWDVKQLQPNMLRERTSVTCLHAVQRRRITFYSNMQHNEAMERHKYTLSTPSSDALRSKQYTLVDSYVIDERKEEHATYTQCNWLLE